MKDGQHAIVTFQNIVPQWTRRFQVGDKEFTLLTTNAIAQRAGQHMNQVAVSIQLDDQKPLGREVLGIFTKTPVRQRVIFVKKFNTGTSIIFYVFYNNRVKFFSALEMAKIEAGI